MSAQTNPAFANPLNLSRLTIGVTNAHGERVALVLAKASADPYAALVPALAPETITADDIPTEHEINELYLRCNGWTRDEIHGVGIIWQDPLCGGAFAFQDALQIQEHREELSQRGIVEFK